MFEKGKIYSFDTLVPEILTESYSQKKCVGAAIDYRIVQQMANLGGLELAQTHATILPHLDISVSSDPNDLTFSVFEDTIGNSIVLAHEWIDLTSVKSDYSTVVAIKIWDAGQPNIKLIREVLSSVGYKETEIDVKEL